MKLLALVLLLSSCAIKHHVQVSDIERIPGKKAVPSTVLISETGVNLKEAANLTSAVTKDNGRAQKIQEIIGMFQMGPRTGNPIYNEKYADIIPELLLKECPSGHVTGLMTIRETAKYPVVSGEIVKIKGQCFK